MQFFLYLCIYVQQKLYRKRLKLCEIATKFLILKRGIKLTEYNNNVQIMMESITKYGRKFGLQVLGAMFSPMRCEYRLSTDRSLTCILPLPTVVP